MQSTIIDWQHHSPADTSVSDIRRQFLGTATITDARTLSRPLPLSLPTYPWMRARNLEIVKVDEQPDSKIWYLKITFEFVPFNVLSDEAITSESERFVEWFEYENHVTLEWHDVPRECLSSPHSHLLAFRGFVNSEEFCGFPPGHLRYEDVKVVSERDSLVTLDLTFSRNPPLSCPTILFEMLLTPPQ